jgi:Fe2+ or Zn2+ uptake regulation protein
MAKQLNPNSGRQVILKVLYDFNGPLTPGQITAILKAEGHEIKYIHSHLNYFKAHGQVLHNEDKTYSLTRKMGDRLHDLYTITTDVDIVEEVLDLDSLQSDVMDEAEFELTEA